MASAAVDLTLGDESFSNIIKAAMIKEKTI